MDNADDMILMNEMDTPVMVRKIGRTTYEVSYHFSTTSTETMNDKIKRLIKREIRK